MRKVCDPGRWPERQTKQSACLCCLAQSLRATEGAGFFSPVQLQPDQMGRKRASPWRWGAGRGPVRVASAPRPLRNVCRGHRIVVELIAVPTHKPVCGSVGECRGLALRYGRLSVAEATRHTGPCSAAILPRLSRLPLAVQAVPVRPSGSHAAAGACSRVKAALAAELRAPKSARLVRDSPTRIFRDSRFAPKMQTSNCIHSVSR